MKILAIDTSSSVLSVAINDGNKLLAEKITNQKMNHSERVFPAIDMLLKEVDVEASKLDGIAVAKGPGSYTGVRIGVTTGKMLAWSLNIPIVGVSSLAILASNAIDTNKFISPIMNARRGQVYTALYKKGEDGYPVSIIHDQILNMDTWLDQCEHLKDDIIFVGEDLSVYGDKIEEKWGTRRWSLNPTLHIPHAGSLAFIGAELIRKGMNDDTHTITPDYLQLAEAEVKWNLQNQDMR